MSLPRVLFALTLALALGSFWCGCSATQVSTITSDLVPAATLAAEVGCESLPAAVQPLTQQIVQTLEHMKPADALTALSSADAATKALAWYAIAWQVIHQYADTNPTATAWTGAAQVTLQALLSGCGAALKVPTPTVIAAW